MAGSSDEVCAIVIPRWRACVTSMNHDEASVRESIMRPQ